MRAKIWEDSGGWNYEIPWSELTEDQHAGYMKYGMDLFSTFRSGGPYLRRQKAERIARRFRKNVERYAKWIEEDRQKKATRDDPVFISLDK